MTRRPLIVLLWLLLLALCVTATLRTRFTADLSAFLPRTPTEQQALLVDLLRDGVVSRLLMIGVEGADADTCAAVSREMAGTMRRDTRFASVNNGDGSHAEFERRWVFDNRYLLSPTVTPARFTADGLAAAIGHAIELLTSSAGMLVKPLIAHDPTLETLSVLDAFDAGSGPRSAGGVWASADGRRALLLATTRVNGADTDGQQATIAALRAHFDEARRALGAGDVRLLVSGPAVFAVDARDTIRNEVKRLSLIGASLIISLLLLVYRSPTALLLGLAPVLTGALLGIVAVGLAFGEVHGVTLGFGITLIGEAIDYAIYFFIQGTSAARDDFWRTIRLGVVTSLCGFGAMLLSGFPGLAQLGLYSMAGLIGAVLTTRYVLPSLVPTGFRVRDVAPLGRRLAGPALAAARLRWPAAALALAALVFLWQQRDRLWHHELSALSPVPLAAQQLDAMLRADLGAPDNRYLVVATADSAEGALQRAEALVPVLERLREAGLVAAYDSPARLLPSRRTQQRRQAALPDSAQLQSRLQLATAGLPLRPQRLQGFVEDVAAARAGPQLDRRSLEGSVVALALDALLIPQGGRWRALLPLSAPNGDAAHDGELDADAIARAIADADVPETVFIDLADESRQMYAGYLREAWGAALGGVAAILLVLLAALRSPRRVMALALPLAAAVTLITALVVLAGERLTLLHLVGMLLVGAVGSNYALFFVTARAANGLPRPETLASLLIANLTTLCGFGVLALSSVPVMHAIGVIVGPGAMFALCFSAMFAARPRDESATP